MERLRSEDSFAIFMDDAERPFVGWDFSHIRDRMITEPLPWSYTSEILPYLRRADAMLDMGTGGGEYLASLQPLPADTCATEAYAPNVPVARERLEPLGVDVAEIEGDDILPYGSGRFDLVINRHESYDPGEVLRILKPGGLFVTQQVGEEDMLDINRHLNAPPPEVDGEHPWNMAVAVRQLSDAGFTVGKRLEALPRTRIYDIGALIYYLNAIPWQVADFSVERYRNRLMDLHRDILERGYLDLTSHRFLVIARKP